MNDLPLVAIGIEPAGDDRCLADRQLLLRPAGIVEIDQSDGVTGRIRRENAHWPPPALATFEWRQFENDDPTEQGGAGGGRLHPLDGPGRQMEGEVDCAGNFQPLQELGDLRADPGQRLDLGEQWIEEFGTHLAHYVRSHTSTSGK